MATEALLIRKGKWLAPADPSTDDLVGGLREGEVVSATIRRPRNPRHHRLFFALLNIVFENQTRYATLEQLLDTIKVATGYYDEVCTKGAKTIYKLRSISFAKMDQTAFSQFYDKVLDLIVTKILPNADRQLLRDRVEEIVGNC